MRVAMQDRNILGPCRWWAAALMLTGMAGCSNIEPVAPADAPITDPTQLYRELVLNHPAATLSTVAPYDTMQLAATPRNALREPMTGLPAPTFRLQNRNDSVRVLLAPDGKVQALGTTTGTGVQVIASLTVGPVTHVDTARIVVRNVANPPRLASLSIEPILPDSTVWSVSPSAGDIINGIVFSLARITNPPLPAPRLIDSVGNAVSRTSLTYASSSLDPDVATFPRWSTTQRFINIPGQVRRVVQTYAYGIAVADTVTYTVTLPIVAGIEYPRDTDGDVRIAPNGFVGWAYNADLHDSLRTNDTTDIVFDNPALVAMPAAIVCNAMLVFNVTQPCIGGNGMVIDNITHGPPASLRDGLMVRQFPELGVYPYHSTRHPERRGRVIVTNDPYARY